MQHIATALARCAELLTLLNPVLIEPEPMADDWPETEPVIYGPRLDLEVGDA